MIIGQDIYSRDMKIVISDQFYNLIGRKIVSTLIYAILNV